MEISGNQKVKAPRQQVFQALLDPEVLKSSVPGCESAEYVELPIGRLLKLAVSTNLPGFKGPYNIFLKNETQSVTGLAPQADAFSRIVYLAHPSSSSLGSIEATCIINLADDPEGTQISYTSTAEVTGKIANVPGMVINGAVKMGIGQFFKNFEKQVSTARV